MSFLKSNLVKKNIFLIGTIVLTAILNFAHSSEILFQTHYSKYDYQFGSSLVNFIDKLSKNQLDTKDVTNLSKNQALVRAFPEVTKIIEKAFLISKINGPNTFYKNCQPNDKSAIPYQDELNKKLDSYCRFLYLKRLTKLPANATLSSRDLNYFQSASVNYISGDQKEELIKLLKKFKKNQSNLKKISDIIIAQSIKNDIRPDSSIVIYIKKNSTFNSFLARNINKDHRVSKSFKDQYTETARSIALMITRKNFKQAVRMADNNHSFFEKNKKFIDPLIVWSNLTIMAQDFFHQGQKIEADKYFLLAKSIATKSKKQEATYNLIWGDVITKDYKKLFQSVKKYKLDETFSQHESKLQYWIAYAFYQNGEKEKALKLFNDIISKTPYSFYSIISLKILAQNNDTKPDAEIMDKLIQSNKIESYPLTKFNNDFNFSLIRLSIWLEMKNDKMIESEINYIQSLAKNKVLKNQKHAKKITLLKYNDFLTLNLIKLLNSKNQFLSSFKIFSRSLSHNSLALNYNVIKYLFPFKYYETIKKNSNSLDPLLILSLMRQESSFNPQATSIVGAKGLMQLMPNTAKLFNRKIGKKQLTIPTTNINIGIKYLNKLNSRFAGNMILILASYNAGENRIDRWRKEIFKVDDPLAMIEAIPFKETRNYVKLIYRNYFFYNFLSNKSTLMTPIHDSFKIPQEA